MAGQQRHARSGVSFWLAAIALVVGYFACLLVVDPADTEAEYEARLEAIQEEVEAERLAQYSAGWRAGYENGQAAKLQRVAELLDELDRRQRVATAQQAIDHLPPPPTGFVLESPTAGLPDIPRFQFSLPGGERTSRSSWSQPARTYAENGSYHGQLNSNGVPKTVRVRGYYRSDGTYVRGHYRSAPGSNP